jgi:DNA adenine methylase
MICGEKFVIIKRVGGKTKIAPWIVQHMPQGSVFVDVFGGSGAVLDAAIAKDSHSKNRFVYNDQDAKIYTFFMVLKNRPHELANLTNLTPYSRYIFEQASSLIKDSEFDNLDEVDKALIFLVANRQCFGSKMDGTWSITRKGEINYETWNKLPKYILKVAQRWKQVYLENLDYKELLPKWDSVNTVFYVDPPYENVEHEYYDVNKQIGFDHNLLLQQLKDLQGSFCVSYYGGETESSDSGLIHQYLELGCRIYRKTVTKHLSCAEEKEQAVEVILVRGKAKPKRSKLIEEFE